MRSCDNSHHGVDLLRRVGMRTDDGDVVALNEVRGDATLVQGTIVNEQPQVRRPKQFQVAHSGLRKTLSKCGLVRLTHVVQTCT